MALNTSGPISIGGSTVGQSINLELGLSATATSSLNDTALRSLAGVASGAISLSNFYGKANVKTGNYYIMTSDTAPSPFVASTFNNGAYATAGSPYQSFDNNNGTYYAGNTTVAGQYVGTQITFNGSINLRKLGIRIGNAGGGRNNNGNIKVDVLTNGTWTNIITYNVSAGGEYENYNVSALYSNVTAIRGYFVYGSGGTSAYSYIYHMQVIEWS